MPNTPNARFQTPTNSRSVESINKRVQQFNNILKKLCDKFSTMRDVDYEKSKIDLVYAMTEQGATGQNSFVLMLLDRLKLIEEMNQQAPSLDE